MGSMDRDWYKDAQREREDKKNANSWLDEENLNNAGIGKQRSSPKQRPKSYKTNNFSSEAVVWFCLASSFITFSLTMACFVIRPEWLSTPYLATQNVINYAQAIILTIFNI